VRRARRAQRAVGVVAVLGASCSLAGLRLVLRRAGRRGNQRRAGRARGGAEGASAIGGARPLRAVSGAGVARGARDAAAGRADAAPDEAGGADADADAGAPEPLCTEWAGHAALARVLDHVLPGVAGTGHAGAPGDPVCEAAGGARATHVGQRGPVRDSIGASSAYLASQGVGAGLEGAGHACGAALARCTLFALGGKPGIAHAGAPSATAAARGSRYCLGSADTQPRQQIRAAHCMSLRGRVCIYTR